MTDQSLSPRVSKKEADRQRALTVHNISGSASFERPPLSLISSVDRIASGPGPSPSFGRNDSSATTSGRASADASPRGSATSVAGGGSGNSSSLLKKALSVVMKDGVAPRSVTVIKPVMSGWLLRKSKLRKIWEPVWCILTPSDLLLFNNRIDLLGDDDEPNREIPMDEIPDEKIEMKKLKSVQQELDIQTIEVPASAAVNLNPIYEEMFASKKGDDKVYVDVLVFNVLSPDRTLATLACGSRPNLNAWLNALGKVFMNFY
jgi:hypothetical protein